MNTIERLQPHSIEAEEAVLGSLLIDPDAILEIGHFLEPDMFYRHANKLIYTAIKALFDQKTPVDLVTLTQHLHDQKIDGNPPTTQLHQIGGEAVIIGLINAVPTSVNAISYAKIIQDKSERRHFIRHASEIANAAYDTTTTISHVRSVATAAILQNATANQSGPLTMQQAMDEAWQDMVNASKSPGNLSGIPSGFHDWDKLTGGFTPGLHVLAAVNKAGKTTIGVQTAFHNATIGNRTYYVSGELRSKRLMQRLLSSEAKVRFNDLRRLNFQNNQEAERAMKKYMELRQMDGIFSEFKPGVTPAYIRLQAQRLLAQGNLDLLIVENFQILEPNPGFRGNTTEKLAHIARQITQIAGEFDIPLLLLAQGNIKSLEHRQDKRLTMSDIAGSSALTAECETFTALYNDTVHNPETSDDPHRAELNLVVGRDVEYGRAYLKKELQYRAFRNMPNAYANPTQQTPEPLTF